MRLGKIKFYNLKSEFGFICELETNKEYYFQLKYSENSLVAGDIVSFELKDSKKGSKAINILKIKDK